MRAQQVVTDFRDVLDTQQVSEQYPFLKKATLRTWRHNGTGPRSFKVGGRGERGRVLYRRSEIERWLADQEQATARGGAA